jgi:biopolymer transport protein ExbD
MLAKRQKTAQRFTGIDVTAMGSVLLALVIFLMMYTTFVTRFPHHNWSVDLAKVNHPTVMKGMDRDDALVVTVTRNGYCFFGNERIAIEDIPMKVRDGLSHGSERKIYIRADARTSYKDIKAVVDAIHQSGIENVAFVVDQRSPDLQKTSSFPRPIPSKQ